MAEKKRVLIADAMDQQAIQELTERYGSENVTNSPNMDTAALESAIGGYDVVFVRSTEVSEKAAANAKAGTVFIRGGAGTDNLKAAKEAGFVVENTPGANAMGVVDLAVGLMGKLLFDNKLPSAPDGKPSNTLEIFSKIAAERRIGEDDKTDRNETLDAAALDILKSDRIPELEGKKILLTGATGSIGKRMTEVAQAMGMEVLAIKERSMTGEYAQQNNITLVETLEEGLKQADIVSLHTALVGKKGEPGATAGIMGQKEFDAMKQGAVLINTGRAGLIEAGVETSVPVAIDDAREKVAELGSGIKNLLVSPKRGAKTEESTARVGEMALHQIQLAMDGMEPINVVTPSNAISEVKKAVDITPEHKKAIGE